MVGAYHKFVHLAWLTVDIQELVVQGHIPQAFGPNTAYPEYLMGQLPEQDGCIDLGHRDFSALAAFTPDLEQLLAPDTFPVRSPQGLVACGTTTKAQVCCETLAVPSWNETQATEPEHSLSFDQSFFSPEELIPAQNLSPESRRYGSLPQSVLEEPCSQAESARALPPTQYLGSQGGFALHETASVTPASSVMPVDFAAEVPSPLVWQQPPPLIERCGTQVAESPFGASTIQSASTIMRPQQWAAAPQHTRRSSSSGYNEHSHAEAKRLIMLGSSRSVALENGAIPASPFLSYGSDRLLGDIRTAGRDDQRAYSVTFGQRYSDVLEAEEAFKRCHSMASEPALGSTARAASTPVVGADFTPAAGLLRPVKRTRREARAAASKAGTSRDGASQRLPPSILLPSHSRGNSIRIVSGKGDFEFPAWRPTKQKLAPKAPTLMIRSNELGKPGRADSDSELGDSRAGAGSGNNCESHILVSRRSMSGENSPAPEVRRTRAGSKALMEREGTSFADFLGG